MRVEAAISVGMPDVPTVRVDHLSPAQIRAYVIADNQLAEKAGWDRELLALELQELSVEPNFDVTVMGFDTAEIDILISEASDTEPAFSRPPAKCALPQRRCGPRSRDPHCCSRRG
jgi:ParB-like chromosome segregation protein Spo0J